MESLADLDDDAKFVTWETLPLRSEGDYVNSYQKREITHHWCLLGQIVWAGRMGAQAHQIHVRDKKGTVDTFMIHCPKRYSIARFRPGKTVALLNFEQRHDRAGPSQLSKTYLNSKTIQIFPFTIAEIISAWRKAKVHYSPIKISDDGEIKPAGDAEDALETPHTCQVCGKVDVELIACGKCDMIWYCKKGDCRKKDRVENGHLATCKVLKCMEEFFFRDWDTFEGFWDIDTGY